MKAINQHKNKQKNSWGCLSAPPATIKNFYLMIFLEMEDFVRLLQRVKIPCLSELPNKRYSSIISVA